MRLLRRLTDNALFAYTPECAVQTNVYAPFDIGGGDTFPLPNANIMAPATRVLVRKLDGVHVPWSAGLASQTDKFEPYDEPVHPVQPVNPVNPIHPFQPGPVTATTPGPSVAPVQPNQPGPYTQDVHPGWPNQVVSDGQKI